MRSILIRYLVRKYPQVYCNNIVYLLGIYTISACVYTCMYESLFCNIDKVSVNRRVSCCCPPQDACSANNEPHYTDYRGGRVNVTVF